ncbi:permease [Corynebacterium felinum]|uniref:Uncharacterized membrane protein YraQ (UPF0718 family) n=1 Tax=Corynebacterium felinum TaxID=131318 RepID=A0ABU2B634_9CORY|nr:permease [Corynebacterium felinum]MDF5820804.1 permease [Corynebacterium felinum]MDR7354080.1 uncharacterized membrane protein YraQ (UPF0718 family) [Corynebacterium felinum]WJY96252.1 putative permease [Corynebacterium felinum]
MGIRSFFQPLPILVMVLLAAFIVVVLPTTLVDAAAGIYAHYPRIHLGLTTFAALCIQALPLVVLGSLASATVGVAMTPQRWAKVLPSHPVVGVGAAAVAGMLVPSCECSSVFLARRMIASGVAPATAMTFMVAAPSVNPLVVGATFVAFGGWEMASARLAAGLLASLGVGLSVALWGKKSFAQLADTQQHDTVDRSVYGWCALVRHDAVSALTFLVIGGLIAAIGSALLPRQATDMLAEHLLLGVVVMAVIAVIVSLCSLGDAFVAASLINLHPAAALSFLTVGPIIDVKLFSMMAGILGPKPARLVAVAGFGGGILATLVIALLWGWLR